MYEKIPTESNLIIRCLIKQKLLTFEHIIVHNEGFRFWYLQNNPTARFYLMDKTTLSLKKDGV